MEGPAMSSASAPVKRDLRQEVTDSIIAALEKGVAPWQRPWQSGAFEMPMNPTSGKPYRGGNAIHLMVVGMRKGCALCRFRHNAHWTGARQRLNRETLNESYRFGDLNYAKEELRAELASVFLMAERGIPHNPDSQVTFECDLRPVPSSKCAPTQSAGCARLSDQV